MNEIVLRDERSLESLSCVKLGSNYAEFDADTPYEEWSKALGRLQNADAAMRWWMGDALLFGERKYGEMYAQAVHETPYENQTLRKSVYVAGRFELFRRRNNLSFKHHQEVASLGDAAQDFLFDAAERLKLSATTLRALVALAPDEREKLIEAADRNKWTSTEVRDAAKALRKQLEGGSEEEEIGLSDGRELSGRERDEADWVTLFHDFSHQMKSVERLGGMRHLASTWDEETREEVLSEIEEVRKTLNSWSRSIRKNQEQDKGEPLGKGENA